MATNSTTTTTTLRTSTLNMAESRRLANESRAARLEMDLATYYALLDICLSRARLMLTPNEAKGLLNALRDSVIFVLAFNAPQPQFLV
jgi:hypothetical protein